MPKKIEVDLDRIIERMENKKVDSKEIIDYFRLLVGDTDTYKNLEEIAWYAHDMGKNRIAKILASYVSYYYPMEDILNVYNRIQEKSELSIRHLGKFAVSPFLRSDILKRIAKLQKEILVNTEMAEEYSMWANILEKYEKTYNEYIAKKEETTKKMLKERSDQMKREDLEYITKRIRIGDSI